MSARLTRLMLRRNVRRPESPHADPHPLLLALGAALLVLALWLATAAVLSLAGGP